MMECTRDKKVRVLIVEDSAQIRARLAVRIGGIDGVQLVGTAATVRDAITLIAEMQPALVILDLHLLDGSGLDVLAQARQANSGCKFIVLTNYPSSMYRERCLELGAADFFDKSTEFVDAIGAVRRLAGQITGCE
jgi:two-component system response regulator YesN